MVWLLPAALAGLVLLAGPLALHLLTRHRARQIPFPSLRFVRASTTAAARLRRPTDVWLLILRIAAVACAVAACAQPLVVTGWRLTAWNARIARVIVIDGSPSMRQPDAAGRVPADLAVEIARAEEGSAVRSAQIVTGDLRDGLTRAARTFDTMPPAQREIVVISDFQSGSIDSHALAAIPTDIGLRFVRAGTSPLRREWVGPAIDGWRGDRWQAAAAVDATSTSTSWTRISGSAPVPGLTIVASTGEESDTQSALRAAMGFGVRSVPLQPAVTIAFNGAAPPASVATARQPRSQPVARLILSLRSSALLKDAARTQPTPTRDLRVSSPWQEVVRDPAGRPLVATAEADGQLLIRTSANVKSTLGAAIIRSVLVSATDAPVPDLEVIQIPDAQLDKLRRDPGPVTRQAWPRVDRTDARWFWGAALLLLLVEGWVRGRAATRPREDVDVRAA